MVFDRKSNSEMTSFLQAIKEDPFDDTPRLIFADWLDDRGDRRGELIRLQCQIIKTPQLRLRNRLKKREGEILQEIRKEWFGPDDPHVAIHIHRGLVRITLPPTHLTTRSLPRPLKNCFEQGWVETVRISRLAASHLIDPICKWSLLKHISHLDLSPCSFSDQDLSKLAESKYLQGLVILDFGYVHFSYEKLIEIASSNCFPNLQYVPRDCDTRLGYLRTLFRQHPHLKWQNESQEAIQIRKQSIVYPPEVGVGVFNNSGIPIGDSEYLNENLTGPGARDFRALILNECSLGDSGVTTLMQSPYLKQLQVLDVGRNLLGNDAVIAIANASEMKNLFYLQLEYNSIEDEGVIALANAPQLSNLKMLDLGPNQVGDQGLMALAESPYLKQLELISLWNNHVTDKGIIAWANSPNASSLRELFIGNNRITDVGAKALANSPYLNNLRLLRLDNNSGYNQNQISPKTRKLLLDRFGEWIEVHSGYYTE